MSNSYFQFKQFTINQGKSAFKVGTDGVLLGACANTEGIRSILDIGTGTGLIALMLAQRSVAELYAIEPDHDSCLEAAGNIAASPWSDRIRIKECRLQDYFPPDMTFDLIVANPPYFINSLRNPDAGVASARHNAGLTQDDLLQGVERLLSCYGRFEVIMPYAEGNVLIASAQHYGLYCYSILKVRPVPSPEIRRLVLSFSRKKFPVTERFLTIEKGKRHDFTEEYINLTKDYYLKF